VLACIHPVAARQQLQNLLAHCLSDTPTAYCQCRIASSHSHPQAAELQSSVLLKGLTPDDDVTALHGHHHRHWHRHGPPHDPHDAPYWEKRHSVKADLIRCLERAAESFDKDNSATWPIAGKAAAQCFLEHLGGCHDA